MIFGALNPEKIWHQQLVHFLTSPVYCSHFTLGNPKKSFFNSIIHTYFKLFKLSQKITNCYPFTHHNWKMSPLYLVKCTTFSSDWRYVCSSKCWWLWNEPVVGWHWRLWKEPVVMRGKWNVRQATLQQMYKVTTFCTDICFQSFTSDQLYHPPCSAQIQPVSQQDTVVPQLVCIANWYLIHVKKWKRWKICA